MASGPFDGSWFFDAQQSSRPHVLQLSMASDGVWTIFDGYVEIKVVTDGKLHRERSTANDERAWQPDSQTLIVVSGVHGREYSTQTFTLSPGGNTLTSRDQSLGWDGKERESTETFARVTPGHSLQGSWQAMQGGKTLGTGAQPLTVKSAPQPGWVIWTDTDGTMTWFLPRSGELLRGKADAERRRIDGPYHDGETFTWKQTSPRRLEFTVYVDEEPTEYAVETISPDGQTLTDILWARGHEEAKVISVFKRQP